MEKPVASEVSGTVDARYQVPACFPEFLRFQGSTIEKKLGYPGTGRFVAFSFHPTACEVIWNDGVSHGFGKGGWRLFLDLVPAGSRSGHCFGSYEGIGTDVLLLDRATGQTYAVVRECAEEFLARAHGKPLPHHHCLCAMKSSPTKEGSDARHAGRSRGCPTDAPLQRSGIGRFGRHSSGRDTSLA